MLYTSNLNGHNSMYILLFGSDHYRPEDHLRTVEARHQFARLPDARKAAAEYSNAWIFRLHFRDGDDLPEITLID